MAQLDLLSGLEKGLIRKEAAHYAFETENAEWLGRARDAMAKLAEEREVTSDDVWRLCPPPKDAHHSVMGVLFKDARFVRVGSQQTRRAEGRARWISIYALKGTEHEHRD